MLPIFTTQVSAGVIHKSSPVDAVIKINKYNIRVRFVREAIGQKISIPQYLRVGNNYSFNSGL